MAALEKNAKDIVVLNLSQLDSICDYFVICTGDVDTQVRAIINHAEKEVRKHLRERAFHREGYEAANWVLLDYVDVVMHVFKPSFREYYRLEDLWSDAERLDVETESEIATLLNPTGRKSPAKPRAKKATKTATKSATKTTPRTRTR